MFSPQHHFIVKCTCTYSYVDGVLERVRTRLLYHHQPLTIQLFRKLQHNRFCAVGVDEISCLRRPVVVTADSTKGNDRQYYDR